MAVCKWYDWRSQTCSINNRNYPFAATNNVEMYGIDLTCANDKDYGTND